MKKSLHSVTRNSNPFVSWGLSHVYTYSYQYPALTDRCACTVLA